jgi:two-component system sensor histidine kinase/response regulator
MGLSELLLDDNQIQSTSRDYVQKIVRSSEALLQMIGSILDISKAEAGKLELNPRPFALKEVLEEARIFEVVAQQKGLAYHQELSGTVAYDLTVNGDFGRIRQILNNLLSNAIKFTSKGSILLKVNYEDKQDYVEASFTVTDTGVGIKPETLPTLFQAYQQAPGTSARYGGTGLGRKFLS